MEEKCGLKTMMKTRAQYSHLLSNCNSKISAFVKQLIIQFQIISFSILFRMNMKYEGLSSKIFKVFVSLPVK